MMRKLFVGVLFTVACATNTSTKHDYVLSGDTCEVYNDQQSCDAHSPCTWIATEQPCQVGQPCPGGGACIDPTGTGSGSSGSGSGGAACACPDGGVCYEQIGGPAQQAGSEPDIQCYPASACPGSCSNPCDEIVGQGTCTPDPNVSGLCLCDNGIR